MWPDRSFLRIWSQLLKKSLMENFIFCAVLHVWHGSEYASDVVLFFISNFEHITEAIVWRCSVKNMFLKILQYSQQNTCIGVSF